ncbi:MAG: hypothetical protein MR883_05800 [Clostridiales bacterium]|nr:hypothetical protein [Clostridiales bacterium]
MSKFDYKKAEADLHDSGTRHPDEIYSYKSEKAIRGYMKENDLNPDKYYKPDGKSSRSKSGSGSGSGTEGCYLTSACVVARGLPDHCEELQTLRFFRDEYLAKQPGGQAEIEQYYALAPRIVTAINQLPNATAVWNTVYQELVELCVQMIHANQNAAAHQFYKSYASNLARLLHGSNVV